jgi:hypothetical protein
MAELTFRSPGVGTTEIDLSGRTTRGPQGVPAAVIGTADQGPAFVPITIASYRDFVTEFGQTDGEKFGPLAIQQWLANQQAGTYLRVLGAGDCKIRTSAGKVTNAGFIVGSQQVQAGGTVTNNVHAYTGGPAGRTTFLGCFMSESAGSTYFSEAGFTHPPAPATTAAVGSIPIIRGVIFVASGVVCTLSSTVASDNAPATAAATTATKASKAANVSQGALIGSVDTGTQQFVMLLNGLKQTDAEGPNIVTASFNPQAGNYFPDVFNTDPLKIEETGHFLYQHYDVYNSHAIITGTVLQNTGTAVALANNLEQVAFVTTGALLHNIGGTTQPNYEGFENRFTHPFSPYVISQKFGGTPQNLFKIHCLNDGVYSNNRFKISIENIQKSNNPNIKFGKFDLIIRDFTDDDRNVRVLEAYRGLSIDPSSERYFVRIIGDMNIYYDFDQRVGSQKLVASGKFVNTSNYIRVEVAPAVDSGDIDKTALPIGYRGPYHLITSGTDSSSNPLIDSSGSFSGIINYVSASVVQRAQTPPIPMRTTIAKGTGINKSVDSQLYWGTQFEPIDSLTEPNKNNAPDIQKSPLVAFTKYMPEYQVTTQNAWVGDNAGTNDEGSIRLDSDTYNNNMFTLENVQIATNSSDVVDDKEWQAALYRRNAALASSVTKLDGTTQSGRFLNVEKDFGDLASKKHYKFSFFVQGGFDGVNIFNEERSKMLDVAIRRENGDSTNQGGVAGCTTAAYIKAIDILKEKSDTDIQLLAIPGIRQTQVTNHAISAIEERFDALYIMDIEHRDAENNVITGSDGQPNVTYTTNLFKARNIDSSFAAAYFPDVVVTDPTTNTNVQVAPSVAVLGAFGLNDSVAHPWFAPAGFARGALKASEVAVKTNRSNLDVLYDASINPITVFPGRGGPTVFGQKTLQAATSALDRINVRRLLIEIRRKVRTVANSFIFEPNRETTLARFSGVVNPILNRIQQQQGLVRFKVQIDTTTTTQADIENNTVRGKIFLQPTRTLEFISLDFVVSNAGTEI